MGNNSSLLEEILYNSHELDIFDEVTELANKFINEKKFLSYSDAVHDAYLQIKQQKNMKN